MSALGRHILVEFLSCNPEIMNDVAVIENSMVQAAKEAGAPVIGYGSFLQATLNFIIVAFCIFIMIKD